MATISSVRCPSCGGTYEGEDGSNFCPLCGAQRAAPMAQYEPPTMVQSHLPPPGYPPPAAPADPSRPNRDRGWLIGLGLVAVLILAAIGAGLYIGGVFSSSGASQSPVPASKVTSTPGSSPAGGTQSLNTPTTPPSGTTSPAQGTTTPAPVPASSSPASVIQTHLEDINSGQYQSAFQLLTSSYQSANPSWPSDRATADPGIKLLSVGTPQYGSGGAQVPVDFYARDRNPSPGSDTQCREFQGTVTMVQESGSWRYDPSSSGLTSTVMPESDSNCPS